MAVEPLAHRPLGDTGLDVPLISLGTVKIGRNQGVKYPTRFELPDDRQVIQLLETAKELGVDLIDTAPAYGTSEERLGQLLPGSRDQWMICSKAGEYFDARGGGQSSFSFKGTDIQLSVEASLKKLRTDYLDIVLIHSDGNDTRILNETDAVETLQRLKDRGDIRAVGFSGKTVDGGLQALTECDVLMVALNLDDDSQLPVIEQARRLNKGILLKKALASGHADAAGSLRHVLAVPGVHSAVVGTLSPDHLRQNVGYLSDLPG